MMYTISKIRGTKRYYVHRVGYPDIPIPNSEGNKRFALHFAADYMGLSYKEYMTLYRRL